MLLLDGKVVSAKIKSEISSQVKSFIQSYKRSPHLVVVLVGDDPASQVYVKNKEKACVESGIKSTVLKLSADISQQALDAKINELNNSTEVDAILVQFPLPPHLNKSQVLSLISPKKDADGLTSYNLGELLNGTAIVTPCTPTGVMKILEHYKIDVKGKKAVVVGRSTIVGKPMSLLLTDAGATVTTCHSKTQNLEEQTSQADILVVAAGKPHLIGKNAVKPGAIVVDVGIHRTDSGKLCGDVNFDEVAKVASALTPVPGGVGPMTIACLLLNTLNLAKNLNVSKAK